MATMFCVGFYAGGTEAEPRGARATMCGLALMILTLLVEMTLFFRLFAAAAALPGTAAIAQVRHTQPHRPRSPLPMWPPQTSKRRRS